LGQEGKVDQEETLAEAMSLQPEDEPNLAVVTVEVPTSDTRDITQTPQAS